MDLERHLIRLLVETYGRDAVVRLVDEVAPSSGGKPARKRRTLSRAEAARKAAEGLTVDDLAAARAKRARRGT